LVCGTRCDYNPLRSIDLRSLYEQAHKRTLTGLHAGLAGVVGRREELAFERGQAVGTLDSAQADARSGLDPATLLQWMKEGRQREVLPYLDRLSDELKPLVELMQQQLER
jgi:two-component system cell cycle response regulator